MSTTATNPAEMRYTAVERERDLFAVLDTHNGRQAVLTGIPVGTITEVCIAMNLAYAEGVLDGAEMGANLVREAAR